MMFEESVDTRQSLHRRVLIAAFILFVQDLSSRGGAQAWTYSYSISAKRWHEAKKLCQERSAEMVVIQNQEETVFLNNLLPFNQRYYWIGIRKQGEEWIWDRTNEKVPEEAQNWALNEPDDGAGQDCVEIYIKRANDTDKWNNDNCRKRKGTICYTASCMQDSCSAHADCVETIGNYTCKCYPGFQGSRCEEAIACEPLLDPEQGYHYCHADPYGPNHFNSSCLFNCELGFQLVGVPQLLCQASGHWNNPAPLCQAEQCPVLNHTSISAGSMTCTHPIAPYSYNSTCEVRCDEGYEPSGQDQIRCDHTGQWTASVPSCKMQKCSPILFPVTGNMKCVDILEPFSFGSRCNFTCQEGYYLTGDNTLTCLASKQWSKPTPTCTVVQCNSLKAPLNASIQCQDPIGVYSYGSICTVQCEEGFDLIGTNRTKCSSHGNWTHALPVCQAKKCDPLNLPHGSISCSDPNGSFSFGSRCTATCDKGFLLNGTANTECNSLGTWSPDVPHCLAKRCHTLNPPSHGSLLCSNPHEEFSFGSWCNITCDDGFVLNGTTVTECTSVGTWSTDMPRCLAKRCSTLSSPSHGSLYCSHPNEEFSFGSHCNVTCEEGFVLDGTTDTECTSLGKWSADMPHCLAMKCPTLNSPSHGSLSCSHPHEKFSFGSRCTSTCEEGFVLNGTASTECNSLGTWSPDVPHCLAKRCHTLNPPSHGSLLCSNPNEEFSFGSWCNITCDDGFVLNGTTDTECTSVGTWSTDMPRCLAKRCSTLSSPPHGSLYCSHPDEKFSFGSHCNVTCEEGFVLDGTTDTECTSLGKWSADMPHCLAMKCPTLNSPSHGSLSCSHPHEKFSFGSWCTSTCEEGFVLNGTADTECTSLGTWSREIPHCLARQCPLLVKAPQHGRMNCIHPYSHFSYSSHCDFDCDEGFWLMGASVITCNNSGLWSQELPTCQPVQCEAFRALPLHLSLNCSHPLGNFTFGSQCLFTCKEGFSLNGKEALSCSSTGFWSDSVPNCTVEGMPLGTAMLMYTGIGAAAVAVPLALIGLGFVIMMLLKKKKGKTIISDAPAWAEMENPAFEF